MGNGKFWTNGHGVNQGEVAFQSHILFTYVDGEFFSPKACSLVEAKREKRMVEAEKRVVEVPIVQGSLGEDYLTTIKPIPRQYAVRFENLKDYMIKEGLTTDICCKKMLKSKPKDLMWHYLSHLGVMAEHEIKAMFNSQQEYLGRSGERRISRISSDDGGDHHHTFYYHCLYFCFVLFCSPERNETCG